MEAAHVPNKVVNATNDTQISFCVKCKKPIERWLQLDSMRGWYWTAWMTQASDDGHSFVRVCTSAE